MFNRIVKILEATESERKSEDVIKIFQLIYKSLNSANSLSRHKRDELTSHIARIILKTSHSEPFINEILRLLNSDTTTIVQEFLIHCLIESSEHEVSSRALKKFLKGNNVRIQEILFYYHVIWPLRAIYQTNEFKISIVRYINSDAFKKTFQEKGGKDGYTRALFAFPCQYSSCFDLTNFSDEKFSKYSKSYLSRLNLKSRIESIRSIEDDEMKLELIFRYYRYYLSREYSTRFIRIVDREFPGLNLYKKYNF